MSALGPTVVCMNQGTLPLYQLILIFFIPVLDNQWEERTDKSISCQYKIGNYIRLPG